MHSKGDTEGSQSLQPQAPNQVQMLALNARFHALREWREPTASTTGPLSGLMVSVKDNIGVDGMQSWAGSSRALPQKWASSGSFIRKLQQLGADINSKSHCAEFAFGGSGFNPNQGTPINPWSPPGTPLIPGGSSSGTAVAVACGLAQLGVGTDTGGSVRVPAALCGCAGYRVTPQHWPMDGVLPLSTRVDALGLIAPQVQDIARVLSAVEGTKPLSAAPLDSLSVALWPDDALADCDAERAAIFATAAGQLRQQGATLVPASGDVLARAFALLGGGPNTAAAEFAHFLQAELPGWRHGLNPQVASLVADHEQVQDDALERRIADFDQLLTLREQLFAGADVLLSPTTGVAPPPIAALHDPAQYEHYSNTLLHFTVLGSLFGCCGISMPAGLDSDGLPMSLQLIARPGDDIRLLQAALSVSSLLPSIAAPARFLEA